MTYSRYLNSLSGQHLRVIWPRWEGNPKGLSGPLKAGVVLEYLSARFNFTYEMVKVTENRLEPPPNGKGLFSYLFDQQCDLLLTDVVPTASRHRLVDMTLPWNYGQFAFLIPVPGDTANMNAIAKPFQWQVWLAILIAMICVIFSLYQFQRLESSSKCSNRHTRNGRSTAQAERQYMYVFGNLVSQGNNGSSRRLPFRVVAGVWILTTLLLVQAFNSTLFSYVIRPTKLPLINSIYDLAESDDINMLVKKAGTLDTLFSNTNDTGMFSKIRDKINSNPQSRCVVVSECINQIKPGLKNAFADAKPYQLDAIKEEFERTGKCTRQLARDTFLESPTTFALPKKSLYTKTVSQGLLELLEGGFIDYWDLWFRPMPRQCLKNIKTGRNNVSPRNDKHVPLSLKNLTGAFVVLVVGYSLSLFVFIFNDHVRFHLKKYLSKKKPLNVISSRSN